MTHHLSNLALPGLSRDELLAFTDARLTQALNLSPTSLSSPSSGSHSSFLETAVGIATLVLMRTIESASTEAVRQGPFGDSWTACAQVVQSATKMAISEDRWRETDDDGGCEVLYGRAGLLYSLLRLRNASRQDIKSRQPRTSDLATTIKALSSDETIQLLVESIVRRGEAGAAVYAATLAGTLLAPPLMWTWHGKRYLGAAHGVGKLTLLMANRFCLAIFTVLPPDSGHPAHPATLSRSHYPSVNGTYSPYR